MQIIKIKDNYGSEIETTLPDIIEALLTSDEFVESGPSYDLVKNLINIRNGLRGKAWLKSGGCKNCPLNS